MATTLVPEHNENPRIAKWLRFDTTYMCVSDYYIYIYSFCRCSSKIALSTKSTQYEYFTVHNIHKHSDTCPVYMGTEHFLCHSFVRIERNSALVK